MDIRGLTGHELYVEQASDIDEEYYAAILFDRGAKKPMAMLSRMGGMDVEEIADEDPRRWSRSMWIPCSASRISSGAGSPSRPGSPRTWSARWARCSARSTRSSWHEDAMLVEVNPLLVTRSRDVVALDAKVTVDGNALYRHQDTAAFRNPSAEDAQEQMAKERGLTYVSSTATSGSSATAPAS